MALIDDLKDEQLQREIDQAKIDYTLFCQSARSENPLEQKDKDKDKVFNIWSKFSRNAFQDTIDITTIRIKADIKRTLKCSGLSIDDKGERKKYRDRLVNFIKSNAPLLIFITLQKCVELCTRVDVEEENISYQDAADKVGMEVERQRIFNKEAFCRTGIEKTILKNIRKQLKASNEQLQIDRIDNNDKKTIGAYLISKVITYVGLLERIPPSHGTDMYRLRIAKKFADYYDPEKMRSSLFKPSKRPMVSTPNDWTLNLEKGGYLANIQTPLIHVKSSRHIKVIRDGTTQRKEQNRNYLKAINTLQKTQWEINTDVLRFIDTEDGKNGLLKEDKTKGKGFLLAQNTLCLAGDFKDRAFYLPWYLDFRGRMYPETTQVSPQSDDLGRSLLLFADSMLVDDEALRHIAIYGHNKYKSDKLSVNEMVQWVEANESNIIKTAKDPFKNLDFWNMASDKYLFLAFCVEWKKLHGSKRESRKSNLPIYVDGTCNGFQHYSALLLDEQGASSVNLIHGDRPRDFYGDVAQEIRTSVLNTADIDPIVKELVSTFMNRKFLKKSIIAAGYGSWFRSRSNAMASNMRSIRESIQNASEELTELLKDDNANPKPNKEQPSKKLNHHCQTIELMLDKAIAKFNPAFSKIKQWIKATSNIVCNQNQCMLWSNPAGLPVYNFYYKYPKIKISVLLHGETHRFVFKDVEFKGELKVDTVQQGRSIAPNFIHSIDSGHAANLITRCSELGLRSIASVHDSFATHAANMGLMHMAIRETFVEIHSAGQLKLFKDAIENNHNVSLPDLPLSGSFDLDQVLESRYAFY